MEFNPSWKEFVLVGTIVGVQLQGRRAWAGSEWVGVVAGLWKRAGAVLALAHAVTVRAPWPGPHPSRR